MREMCKVLVTGGNGQLGRAIKDASKKYKFEFIYTDTDDFDIADYDQVSDALDKINPDIIINCAAYTAVDNAEEDQDIAFLINTEAVENLASQCYERNIFLIHISTDYVFDGRNFKPYKEHDPTNPLSVYGISKLSGERNMIMASCNGVIIRTSWLYYQNGNNFVSTMLRLADEKKSLNVVCDQIGSPTYAGDLANVIMKIIENRSLVTDVETYHYSNEGVCSWYDFASAIIDIAEKKCKVMPLKSSEYPTRAQRPHYSVLDKSSIKEKFGLTIPNWRDSLANCIKEFK